MEQVQKRKIRNIHIDSLENEYMKKRIESLSKDDAGVNFCVELKSIDDEFTKFFINVLSKLKNIGLDDFNVQIVTLDEDSRLNHIKLTTRILGESELENLILIESLLPKKANLFISEKYNGVFKNFSLDNAVKVNQLINLEVDYIKSLELSPFEQYLMAYDFMSNFCYNNDEKDIENGTEYMSRLLTSALSNEYFVCSAYSKVFCGVLTGLGIDCVPEYLYVNCGSEANRQDDLHVNVLVNLCDPKYGIDGIVFTDACNDARKTEYTTTKNGNILFSAFGEVGYLLSAINLNDIRKMRTIFTVDEFSSLKFLYGDTSKLLGSNYKAIFDGFEDQDFLNYLEFFSKNHPELGNLKDYDENLSDEDWDKIDGVISNSIKKIMLSVFGNREVASAIEKCDKSNITESVVLYSSDLSRLFKQAVILKINGIDDKKIKEYMISVKQQIIDGIDGFDKDYEVEKVLKHNQYISSKYGKQVGKIKSISLEEYLKDYIAFGEDFYSHYMLFCFSQREKIAALFEKIKKGSPIIEMRDYSAALSEILKKQGYNEGKIASFVSHKLENTAKDADFWFCKDAENRFLKFSNQKWEEINNNRAY